jgi:nanoRNase/pAp phosphatase (c-di-AMP/oligoRNAs hydrolase)
MFNELNQLNKLIENSQRPLIVFDVNLKHDAIASALALKSYLQKKGKKAEIVSSGYTALPELGYLKSIDTIKPELSNLHKFTIKVDIANVKIDTLSYDISDDWLSIHITPRHGIIGKNNLRTLQTGFKYDLIFILGATELNSLGNTFFNNTDLFYRTPLINIDINPANEHFATLNIVDLTACSISEVIYKIMNDLGLDTDAENATALLTGMIARTRSFKTPSVTPATLNLAGKLMGLGADREIIIKNLYRTKTISTLKLWGRALYNLQTDQSIGLVSTIITRDDFSRSGATAQELPDLVSELIANSPDAKFILIIYEDEKNNGITHFSLTVDKKFDAKQLTKLFKPEGDKKTVKFAISNKSIKEAESAVIDEIKNRYKILYLLN